MKNISNKSKAILIDITKCTGCEKCVEACVSDNDLNPVIPMTNAKEDGLSGNRFTSIVQLNWNHFAAKIILTINNIQIYFRILFNCFLCLFQ